MRARRETTRKRRGGVAVEMAVIAPVFISMIFGQIESSRLGMVAQLLSTAAREGARVAVINGKTQSDVQTRITTVLAGSGISVGTVNPTPTGWDTSSNGTAITVSLSVPYSQVSWLPTPYYLNTATVAASATMNSERP
jgi:Flp pilus assembly protein TadG